MCWYAAAEAGSAGELDELVRRDGKTSGLRVLDALAATALRSVRCEGCPNLVLTDAVAALRGAEAAPPVACAAPSRSVQRLRPLFRIRTGMAKLQRPSYVAPSTAPAPA